MGRALAVNVAANTTLPGFRAPVYPDGSFLYVPIPEREPTASGVPTYADLDLPLSIPPDLRSRRVHLDPAFRGYHDCAEYTYGDEHGVKAGPISGLTEGDHLLFYATLDSTALGDGAGTTRGDPPSLGGERPPPGEHPDWMCPEWGAYLVGGFRLGFDPVTGDEYADLPPERRRLFDGNAHVKRREFDARVLAYGDPDHSRLFDRAVPLSDPAAGSSPGRVVDLSGDSGRGPWWRRPLPFDDEATAKLLAIVDRFQNGDQRR